MVVSFSHEYLDENDLKYIGKTLPELLAEENLAKESGIKLASVGKEYVVEYWSCPVPYVIRDDIVYPQLITTAIEYISRVTDWEFKERTSGDMFYINFRLGDGCSSPTGQTGRAHITGPHHINISPKCSLFTVVHEICHALGLSHTISRDDRDNYVTVNTENIEPENVNNYNKVNNLFTGDYDFDSVMHYADDGFTINGKPTFTVNNPDNSKCNVSGGQRYMLSADDIRSLNNIAAKNGCKPSSLPPVCSDTDIILCPGADTSTPIHGIYNKTDFLYNKYPVYRSENPMYNRFFYIVMLDKRWAVVLPSDPAKIPELPDLSDISRFALCDPLDLNLLTTKWIAWGGSEFKDSNYKILERDCDFPDLAGYTEDNDSAKFKFWEWSTNKLVKYIVILLLVIAGILISFLLYTSRYVIYQSFAKMKLWPKTRTSLGQISHVSDISNSMSEVI
jgi:hypothetical protein